MGRAFEKLYNDISSRKNEAADQGPYLGGNGRIDRAVNLILNEDFPRSGTLLDVGGATGNLGYALREFFTDRHVVDIADACCEPSLAKGNQFHRCNVDDAGLPMPDETVDLVAALDFIEHILDPQRFARECFRVLKPGGKVLINTPNIQYWRHIHSLVVDGMFPHTSGDEEVYHGGHVAFFNVYDMVRIFGPVGFKNLNMHTRGLQPDPPPPIWLSICNFPEKSLQLSFADLIVSCTK